MPLILSGNVASATASTGYTVANSCRFDGSSAYMHKTPGSEGDKQKWTFSTWVKRSLLGTTTAVDQHLISADAGNCETYVFFLANSGSGATSANTDCLNVYSTDSAGNIEMALRTTPLYRDPSAWMHVCVAIDTTQGTDTNRAKIYVNGTQITSFSLSTYPAQNENLAMCDDVIHEVARRPAGTTKYFNGYLAETVLIDGSQLAPTSFGEFDSDSPTIWKPIDVSGLTFGTNGFYLDFEDSANLGNDANGGTDLTEANLDATDQATDTPTNNFATLNPLAGSRSVLTVAEGNLQFQATVSWCWLPSTICPSNGKWYYECAIIGSDPIYVVVGVVPFVSWKDIHGETIGAGANSEAESVGYNKSGDVIQGNSTVYSGTSYGAGDTVCVAVDLDNRKIYFRKNDDAWENSGDPTSGATGTGAVDLSATLSDWSLSASTSGTNATNNMNYGGGCAYTISSGNADGNGYGNFEYAPPSGYLALCTKNLGSDGG